MVEGSATDAAITPCSEVRRTCAFVMTNQSNIAVNEGKIGEFIAEMEAKIAEEGSFVFDKWSDFHLSDIAKYSVEQVTAYCFVVDAMNFCFWPDNPAG